MLDALEARRWGAPHPLGEAVGGDQLRVGGFELQQLPIEAVVNRILHLGSIEHVVGMGGPGEQPPQLVGAGLAHSRGLRQQPAW